MTDPQLPPPYGSVPPVPPAPAFPAPQTAPQAPPAPPAYGQAPSAAPAPGHQAPAAPGYQAPPGAYQVPVGGYAAPAGTYAVPDTAAPSSKILGTVSLILALVAAVVTPIVAAIAAYEIGRRIPEAVSRVSGSVDSLAFLSPARDQVLWAELSFWGGTILGIAAIVIGIMAIARKRGRGQGIAGLIIAAVGPAIFFVVLVIALGAGGTAGTVGLYS